MDHLTKSSIKEAIKENPEMSLSEYLTYYENKISKEKAAEEERRRILDEKIRGCYGKYYRIQHNYQSSNFIYVTGCRNDNFTTSGSTPIISMVLGKSISIETRIIPVSWIIGNPTCISKEITKAEYDSVLGKIENVFQKGKEFVITD
ncbi:MAG: hypothetical protein FWC41_13230 [Firmicutes bacterium]|nr:hypothetical protein [Bacillota bacterium]